MNKTIRNLASADLRVALPEAKGLSPSSIKYTRYFYELYSASSSTSFRSTATS